MGTSSSYGGPGGNTPLVPSWLDGGDGNSDEEGGNDPSNHDSNQDKPVPPESKPIPPVADPTRFRIPRSNFTRFVNSSGTDRVSLGRALAGYVSTSSGGARSAAQRMGSSRNAGAALVSFLSNANSVGARQALRALNLENLAGQPIEVIFLGLTDYICPDGGTVDEGIARSAFIETIAELAENGITDLDSLTADQIQTVMEIYASHTIEARLLNDIGTKICFTSKNVSTLENIQQQIHDFILGGVSDALTTARAAMDVITPDKALEFVDNIYERAFQILEAMGEQEAQGE